MKKLFTFILFCSVLFFAEADSWVRKTDFPGGDGTGSVFSIGFSIGNYGYIYTCAINNGPVTYRNDFWAYDPLADSWTQKADFPGAHRFYSLGFSIGSKGYIGTGTNGGYPSPFINDLWEYNPTFNIWTQKANAPVLARSGSVGFSIGNKGYIGTGLDSTSWSSYLKDLWEYDPATDSWTRKSDLGGISREFAVGFSIGGKGYIGIGGGVGKSSSSKDFWEYDPILNVWSQKADFGGLQRIWSAGFSIGNKGYIGTGYDVVSKCPSYYMRDFWEYDPSINIWTKKADFGTKGRYVVVSLNIGNKGYLGMGKDSAGVIYKDFWEYTPDSVITGLEELSNPDFQLSVYPNPASEYAVVSMPYSNGKNIKLAIFDVNGKEVSAVPFDFAALGDANNGQSEQSRRLDISTLSPGLYFMEATCGTERAVRKFLKE